MKHWTFSGQKSKREKSVDQAAVQALLRKDIENELGKILGMEWETEEDVIQFRLCSLENEEETTTRSCLSTMCKFYDPIDANHCDSKDHHQEDLGVLTKDWLG